MSNLNCINTFDRTYPPVGQQSWVPWLKAGMALIGRDLKRVFDTLYVWQDRANQRRALMTLDDRMLKDVGISRAQAEEEYRKPFYYL